MDKKEIKEIEKLLDIQREFKEHGVEVEYHGLKELNDDGYPYFVQWGHELPVLAIGNGHHTKFLKLPLEIAFAIEKMLGNVKAKEYFLMKIDEAFKIKKEVIYYGTKGRRKVDKSGK